MLCILALNRRYDYMCIFCGMHCTILFPMSVRSNLLRQGDYEASQEIYILPTVSVKENL